MTFTTLVVTAALTYFLIPQIVMGKSAWKDGLRILFVIFLIRTAWMLFTLAVMWGLYFIRPEFLSDVLQSAITSIARYAGSHPVGIDLLDFLVKASVLNLLQIPIIFVIQIISVMGLFFLINRVFKWYSFIRTSRRFKWIVFGLTFGVLFVILTLVMPMGMVLLNGTFSTVLGVSSIFAILGMLVLMSGGIWFFVQDKRYYQKCPSCNLDVSQLTSFGTNCVICGRVLHPWLWVECEDE
jgi:hypothetical protein